MSELDKIRALAIFVVVFAVLCSIAAFIAAIFA